MVLFCVTIRRVSVSLLKFPFYSMPKSSRVQFCQFIAWKIHSCFSSHFCFLILVTCQVVIMLPLLQLATVIHLSLLFLILSTSLRIDRSTQSSSFLDINSLSISSLGYNTWCIIINFLVLWSIYLSSSIVPFKNGPEYLTRGIGQVLFPFDKISAERAWFQETLSFYRGTLSLFSFHNLHLFDGVRY